MLHVRKEIKEVIAIFFFLLLCLVSVFLPHPDYKAEVDCIGGGQYIAKCYTASFEVMLLMVKIKYDVWKLRGILLSLKNEPD